MAPTPILVTGAGGFVGSWLVPALRHSGHEVVGARKPSEPHFEVDVTWADVDLRDAVAVERLLADLRPSAIVHLAAIAVPRDAARDPDEALRVNYAAVDHLLRGMAAVTPDTRLLFVSSSEAYGSRRLDDPPILETEPLNPLTPYAATKAAAERRVLLAVEDAGLDVVVARPFNHTGPRRPPVYAESAFAKQVAELEGGDAEPVVRVGNLVAVRDFSDVRDVADAYLLLLEAGVSGEVYNVCSNVGRSISSVLDHLLRQARRPLTAQVDPVRYQEIDPDRAASVGSSLKLRTLGWEPRHAFEETLDDLLSYWREAV